jgi:hypothetical protein
MKRTMIAAAALALMMTSSATMADELDNKAESCGVDLVRPRSIYPPHPTPINGEVAHHAGMCRDEINRYNKNLAEDDATDKTEWAPSGADQYGAYHSAEENNDRLNACMKANIIKGCAPGGIYDQLDEAIRQIKVICAANPDKKGC